MLRALVSKLALFATKAWYVFSFLLIIAGCACYIVIKGDCPLLCIIGGSHCQRNCPEIGYTVNNCV